jgi:hypothetical protein
MVQEGPSPILKQNIVSEAPIYWASKDLCII